RTHHGFRPTGTPVLVADLNHNGLEGMEYMRRNLIRRIQTQIQARQEHFTDNHGSMKLRSENLGSMHDATRVPRESIATMHGGQVVPKNHVPHLPLLIPGVLRLGYVFPDSVKQGLALIKIEADQI